MNSLLLAHRKKLMFLAVGGINTIVGISIFPLLYYVLRPLDIHYVLLLVISQIAGITFSYVTNKLIVFRTRGWLLSEYLRFATYYGVYFLINLGLLPFCVEILKQDPVVSQIIISLGSVFATYFWHSRITFVTK